jgi:hypothetical protein
MIIKTQAMPITQRAIACALLYLRMLNSCA